MSACPSSHVRSHADWQGRVRNKHDIAWFKSASPFGAGWKKKTVKQSILLVAFVFICILDSGCAGGKNVKSSMSLANFLNLFSQS